MRVSISMAPRPTGPGRSTGACSTALPFDRDENKGRPAAMASRTLGGTLHLPGSRATLSEPAPRTTIKSVPVIRNVYSCRFPEAALPPEFSKRRPVIVVSWKNSLTGPVLVVPITTQDQPGNPWAVQLVRNPSPGESCDVWVVCNHLYTVSCTRLSATHGTVPRLTPAEFLPIHAIILKWVPTLLEPRDLP